MTKRCSNGQIKAKLTLPSERNFLAQTPRMIDRWGDKLEEEAVKI